ncbi:hypothetical protein Tco_1167317 [Tanacetum coccineum]
MAEKEVSTADPVTTASVEVTTANATKTTDDDLTLAQTLIEIRSARPKAKGIVFREQEPKKPIKRKDQIRHDEEVSLRLQAQMQAELEEEDRLVSKSKEKPHLFSLGIMCKALIDADYQWLN